MKSATEPYRLHPAEGQRLTALALVGLLCLAIPLGRRMVPASPRPVPLASCTAFRCDVRVTSDARRALWMGILVDLNSADATALEVVPGIGPALSERIVADRARRGAFRRLEDVVRVRGIGPGKLEQMRPFVTVRLSSRSGPG